MYINNSLVKLLSTKLAFPTINIEVKLKHTDENKILILNSDTDKAPVFINNIKVDSKIYKFKPEELFEYKVDDVSFKIEAKNHLDTFSSSVIGSTRDFFAQSNDEDLLNQICDDEKITKPFEKLSKEIKTLSTNELILNKTQNLNNIFLHELLSKKLHLKGKDFLNDFKNICFTNSLTIILTAYSKDDLVKALLSISEQNLHKSYLRSIKVIVTKSLDLRKKDDDIFYQITEYTKSNAMYNLQYVHKEFSQFLEEDMGSIESELIMIIKASNELFSSSYISNRLIKHHIGGNFISLQMSGSENIYLRHYFHELKGIIFERGSIMFNTLHLKKEKTENLEI